jgi:hypothetical protein
MPSTARCSGTVRTVFPAHLRTRTLEVPLALTTERPRRATALVVATNTAGQAAPLINRSGQDHQLQGAYRGHDDGVLEDFRSARSELLAPRRPAARPDFGVSL